MLTPDRPYHTVTIRGKHKSKAKALAHAAVLRMEGWTEVAVEKEQFRK